MSLNIFIEIIKDKDNNIMATNSHYLNDSSARDESQTVTEVVFTDKKVF